MAKKRPPATSEGVNFPAVVPSPVDRCCSGPSNTWHRQGDSARVTPHVWWPPALTPSPGANCIPFPTLTGPVRSRVVPSPTGPTRSPPSSTTRTSGTRGRRLPRRCERPPRGDRLIWAYPSLSDRTRLVRSRPVLPDQLYCRCSAGHARWHPNTIRARGCHSPGYHRCARLQQRCAAPIRRERRWATPRSGERPVAELPGQVRPPAIDDEHIEFGGWSHPARMLPTDEDVVEHEAARDRSRHAPAQGVPHTELAAIIQSPAIGLSKRRHPARVCHTRLDRRVQMAPRDQDRDEAAVRGSIS